MTVMFQVESTETFYYVQAILYVFHIIDSSAAIQELQNSILTSSLVNLADTETINFEVDQFLELLNNNLKVFQCE